MSFTQDEVNKLAHLARLALNEDSAHSANSIAEDLRNILQLVRKIDDIKTADIVPMEHSLNAAQRFRADEVTEKNVREEMQKLVTDDAKVAGLYLVPKVVE